MRKTYSYDEIKYLNDDMKFACGTNMLLFAKDEKEENDSILLLINNLLSNTSNHIIILKVRDIKKIVGDNASRKFEYWTLENNEEDIDKLIIESYKNVIKDDNLFAILEHDMLKQALGYIALQDESYKINDAKVITEFKRKVFNYEFEKLYNFSQPKQEDINYYSYDDLKYLNDNQMVGVVYKYILNVYKNSTDIQLKIILRKYINKDNDSHNRIFISLNELKVIAKLNDLNYMKFSLDMSKEEYYEAITKEITQKINNPLFLTYIMENKLEEARALTNNISDLQQKKLAIKLIKILKAKSSDNITNINNKSR